MKKYQHKENGQIGEVVHFKGVTTTLRFEDGSEQIITKANLKRWWELIEDTPDEVEVKEEVKEKTTKQKMIDAMNKAIAQSKRTELENENKQVAPQVNTKNMTWSEMKELFINHNKTSNKAIYGVVVYSNDNFEDEYSELSRSYRVSSNNNAFKSDKISNSIKGDCLDNSESGVRLDWYNWKVEYCYLEN